MKAHMPVLAMMTLGVAACAPPLAAEFNITSSAPPTASPSDRVGSGDDRFCLHFRMIDRHYILLGSGQMQSWVTAGECGVEGPRRPVQDITIGWRHDKEQPVTRECKKADSCNFTVRYLGYEKRIACSTAIAADGNQSAYGSTDPLACR